MSNAIARRIEELERMAPPLTAETDLEAYWDAELKHFAQKPLNATRTPVATPYAHMEIYRVVYEGFDETPIHGWFLLPKFGRGDKPLPCVVIYHGYTGSKGYPEEYAAYLMMGVAVFAIDVRGQAGDTGNKKLSTARFLHKMPWMFNWRCSSCNLTTTLPPPCKRWPTFTLIRFSLIFIIRFF